VYEARLDAMVDQLEATVYEVRDQIDSFIKSGLQPDEVMQQIIKEYGTEEQKGWLENGTRRLGS